MGIEAILWDMDGVLIDSEPLKYEAWKLAIEHHGGNKFEKADYVKLVGRGSDAIVEELVRKRFITREVAKAVLAERNQIYDTSSIKDVKLIDASVDLLIKIDSQRVNESPCQVLVSAESYENIAVHLNKFGLDQYLKFAKSTEGLRTKPAPDGYKAAIDLLGISSSEGVAIEDTPSGVQAAKRAGLKVVGLSSEWVKPERLKRAHADLVVPSLGYLSTDFYKQL